jgi:hypothetical protein
MVFTHDFVQTASWERWGVNEGSMTGERHDQIQLKKENFTSDTAQIGVRQDIADELGDYFRNEVGN